MHVITARNAHQALPVALHLLNQHGIREDSRNGPVLRHPTPVTTVLTHPAERVVFHPWRDANPFFHVVEAAWMLAGRDDLKQLTPYAANMKNYSDDGGVTQPAAYGKRWRNWGIIGVHENSWPDQLDWAVKRLRANSNDRRVVIQMWDPGVDIENADNNGNDVPCNLTVLPWITDGTLHLTVFNRSHDILWGLYGANAVHMSLLLEYLAGRLGLAVGTMTTVSNNFHAYVERMPGIAERHGQGPVNDPYAQAQVQPYSLYTDWEEVPGWERPKHKLVDDGERERIMQEDLRIFLEHGAMEAATKARWPWMRRVLVPMALAHRHWKKTKGEERYTGALEILEQCQATDWRRAASEWIVRRQQKAERAADDGVRAAGED